MNIPRSLSLLALLLSLCANLSALDPHRRISQYGHTAWRVQDGEVEVGNAFTQTKDGYFWLGTRNGLFRLDGVKFVLFPVAGVTSPNRTITSLVGSRDGSLWIGTTDGLARLKDGVPQWFSNPEEHIPVAVIFEDRNGTIWTTRYRVPPGKGPLCRAQDGSLQCYRKDDGISVKYGLGITEDREGSLWFGSNVLCRWRPGSWNTYFDELTRKDNAGSGVVDVATSDTGVVWATIDGTGPGLGVRQFSNRQWGPLLAKGFNGSQIRSHALYYDHDQSLWVGTENDGLYRIHDGVADHYASADGLSGNSVVIIYEDHEDNLWVLTEGGIDMFRNTAVVNFAMREGLSSSGAESVLARSDGSILLAVEGALDILRDGNVSVLRANRDLPGQDVEAQLEDHTGTVWLSIDNSLFTYRGGKFTPVRRPNGSLFSESGGFTALTEDTNHEIWAVDSSHKVYRISDRGIAQEDPISRDPAIHPMFLASDQHGGIYLASRRGMIYRYRSGHLDHTSVGDQNNPVLIFGLTTDSQGNALLATSQGLRRWNGEQLSVMGLANGLPCEVIASTIFDKHNALWLYATCGLIRIDAPDLDKWIRRPDATLAFTVFDSFDGAHARLPYSKQPSSTIDKYGRLWFVNGASLQMIDPDRLFRNTVPPPVYVESITANHRKYPTTQELRLPRHTNDLEIDYTALSATVPQKVRFRYQLEGHDEGWQDAGTRRQAFYTNLKPGDYRFRVMASNNSGVWSEQTGLAAFSVAPAWYQHSWFWPACAIVVGIFIWILHRFRLRQLARMMNARFDERLDERTRITRELHDSFLQTVQGSKLIADDALENSSDPAKTHAALHQLSTWLEQATQEGRAALNSLRASTTVRNDLAEAFRRATENTFTVSSMASTLVVVGSPREIHPIVRDEVYRIGYEAIRNAFAHSGGSLLEVELRYDENLRLRIRDNGAGMDPAMAVQGREGHFGLVTMRERAARIGAQLTILTSPANGTEISLLLPGGISFGEAHLRRPSRLRDFYRRVFGKSGSRNPTEGSGSYL